MIVEVVDVEPDELEVLSPDNTLGMLYQRHGEHFPEGTLFCLNRVQAAIAEFRNEFDQDYANIGLWKGERADTHLALWPDNDRSRALVVAPRKRPEERGQQ